MVDLQETPQLETIYVLKSDILGHKDIVSNISDVVFDGVLKKKSVIGADVKHVEELLRDMDIMN